MNDLPILPTRVAHAGWDEHDYFGYKLFRDLAGSESYSGLLGLAVAGRRLPADAVAVLDAAAGVLALGEPRIWPLKLTRLGSAYGRVLPGILAGDLCFESHILGPLTIGDAAALLVELREMDSEDARLQAIRARIESKKLPGFGVAFRETDERLEALRVILQRTKRDLLPNWQFAESVWKVVGQERGLAPNAGTAIAAALLDCGLTPKEIGPLAFTLMQSVMLANAFEGAAQAPEVLRQLPDAAIEYVGTPARTSPRSRAKASVSFQLPTAHADA